MRLFLLLLSYFVMVELTAQSNLLVLKKKNKPCKLGPPEVISSSGSQIASGLKDL